MTAAPAPGREVALSEVLGALSYALDIAEGEPPGHAVRSAAIGMRLAAQIELGKEDRSALVYARLLKDAGCSGASCAWRRRSRSSSAARACPARWP
jgi:hypothetical protein